MKTNKSNAFIFAFIAGFGAFVVGLNLGGISGALSFIEQEFQLSSMMVGLVTSALMVGCLVGALLGGGMSDKYGRKPMLFVSALLLMVSALGCAFASSAVVLIISRVIAGLGVGILSAVIPTYISEISPTRLRGTFVSFYQLFVVIGILVAYCANYGFSGQALNWRLMLGMPSAIALLSILSMLALPESPRWLLLNSKDEAANKAIERFKFDKTEEDEIRAAGVVKQEKSVKFSELFKKPIAHVVFLGSMLAFFQQITGINVIINYAPGILSKVGIAGSNPLLQTIIIGAANLLFTLIALWMVDKFGRKTLLLWGCAGLVVSLGYLTYAFATPAPSNLGVLIAIIAYIAFFALSLSPLMFVVTSEMYPSHIRGTAMALSTGISWASAFICVQFYPWMESTLGTSWTFAIFGVLCLVAGLFIKFLIPETKGKVLEDIQKELGL